MSPMSQILLKPFLPNFVLSTRRTVCCDVFIIILFRFASIIFVVVTPNSRSTPSAPIKSRLQLKYFSISSAKEPTTETELSLTIPPSCTTSICLFCDNMEEADTEADMTVIFFFSTSSFAV